MVCEGHEDYKGILISVLSKLQSKWDGPLQKDIDRKHTIDRTSETDLPDLKSPLLWQFERMTAGSNATQYDNRQATFRIWDKDFKILNGLFPEEQ